jgi:hypothetical protein
MPLLFKPKFCCHCGEVTERAEWKLWTSRRFCLVCESTQKQHDLWPRAVVAAGLIVGLLGISGFLARQAAPPTRTAQLVSPRPASTTPGKFQELPAAASNGVRNDRATNAPLPNNSAAVTKAERFEPSKSKTTGGGHEDIYFCGAATKKGTPCSRRVKAPGRCWQHMGQPSMIADTRVPAAN